MLLLGLQLETEMTYTSFQDINIKLTGITATDRCSNHVAFDNFETGTSSTFLLDNGPSRKRRRFS